ncbi:MAG: hypothetical protein ABWZ98_11840 [Nakamurella sp.]
MTPPDPPEPASAEVRNPPRTRNWRRTASAAAIVAVLVIGNATQAQAASAPSVRTAEPETNSAGIGDSVPSASADGSGLAPDDVLAGDTGSALHGEFKVLNRDGSAQLRRWQSGQVDAMDNLALTVRSADGYRSRYLLGPGVSVTGIGVGDEVTVVGAGQAVAL